MARHLLRLVVLLAGILLLAGCSHLPKTLPLSPVETEDAQAQWQKFLHQPRPSGIDADYRLRWDVMGSKGGVDAVVQMRRPAFLRFAANDPLGRALVLAVSDGKRFTLVDNRAAEVYQGKVSAQYWRHYVPDSLEERALFPALGGFVDPAGMPRVGTRRDEQGQGYWYIWSDTHGMRHYVLLDNKQGRVLRHLFINPAGKQVLDLRYSGAAALPPSEETGLFWPGTVAVSGTAVSGEVDLHVEKIYSFAPNTTTAFSVTPPPAFTVKQVD